MVGGSRRGTDERPGALDRGRAMLLSGYIPDLPPPARAVPVFAEAPASSRRRPRFLQPRALKDWSGWVSPRGTLVALRRAEEVRFGGYLWWFRCLLCGGQKRMLPSRVRAGDLASCGCLPPMGKRARVELDALMAERFGLHSARWTRITRAGQQVLWPLLTFGM